MVDRSLERRNTRAALMPASGRLSWRRMLDKAILGQAKRRLKGRLVGTITITFPSGRSERFGTGGDGIDAEVRVRTYRPLLRCLHRGPLGFAESYLRDEVETPDLMEVFRFFIANQPALDQAGKGWFRVRRRDKAYHGARRNTRRGSRRNIAEHYDLGNAFYSLWLDEGMQYSSALFREHGLTLEAAQQAKLDLIMESLALKPGMKVLEIGCGWGAVAERTALAGGDLVGLTLSREQAAYARERLDRLTGAPGRGEIRIEDYRDVSGTYDRLVSIEMIEAVGEEYWPAYFETLKSRMAPDGAAIIQAITISEDYFESYRNGTDFIQRYVFPGGMLPTKTAISEQAARAGLDCETIREFGPSYAETLKIWRERFDAAWPQIRALGFDERFRRLWNYYLMYCEAGFETNAIDVGLYRLSPRAS